MTVGEISHASRSVWNSAVTLSLAALAIVRAQAPIMRDPGEGRRLLRLSRRERHFADGEHPSLAASPIIHPVAAVFFRAGSRKNDQMQPIAEQITNEDIRNLGAYFAQLTPPKAAEDDESGSVEEGRAGAVGRRCASCHTDSYAGTKAVARARGPARGISRQGAARLQEQPARRRRWRCDGRCRLSPER
jgi:cytochrome c553